MNYFFQEFYERGVGFGATLPGAAWIAFGIWGVVAIAAVYGVFLGLLDKSLCSMKSAFSLLLYLFAMPQIAAIAGNQIESVDKILATLTPAAIPYVAQLMLGSRFRQRSYPNFRS